MKVKCFLQSLFNFSMGSSERGAYPLYISLIDWWWPKDCMLALVGVCCLLFLLSLFYWVVSICL